MTSLWSRFALLVSTFCIILTAYYFSQPNHLRFASIHLIKNPKKLRYLIPTEMYYPRASLQWVSFYEADPFFSRNSSILVAESSDSQTIIEKYYLREISKLGWQIIQHQRKTDKMLLMAESPSHLLLTIILEDDQPTVIKLYAKPASF